MHEPAVAEIPSHRRSLKGTFLVAVVGLLGVVALFETGTTQAVAGYAAPLAVRPTAAHMAPLPPQLLARPRMQVPSSDDAAAKAAWFVKQAVPAWLGVSEEDATAAWLAHSGTRDPAPEVAAWGEPEVSVSEAEAKAAWLAKQEVPSWGPSESGWSQMTKEQAKQKWLAASEENAAVLDRLRERYTRDRAPEVPAWEETAVVAEADTRDTAPEVQMTEDAAKAAWLASNAPAWGPSAGKMSEEEARQQWLAKMDAPAWGPSAPALEVAPEPQMAQLTEDCHHGSAAACETLAREEEAKAAWFAKQDAPAWGKPTEMQAKQKWLAASEANAAALDQLRERYTRDQAPDVPVWEEPEVPAWEETAVVDEVVDEAETRDTAPGVPAWGVPLDQQARQQWRADRDTRDTPYTHWAQHAVTKQPGQPEQAPMTTHGLAAATTYPFFKRSPGDGGVHLSEEKYLIQDCKAGHKDACETLAKEDEAKKAWLGKHETRYVNPDVLSWGKRGPEDPAPQQWYNQRDARDVPRWR